MNDSPQATTHGASAARNWLGVKILALVGLAALAAQWFAGGLVGDAPPSERVSSSEARHLFSEAGGLIDGSEDVLAPVPPPVPVAAPSAVAASVEASRNAATGPPPASPVAPTTSSGDAPPYDPLPPSPDDPVDPMIASPGPEGYLRVSLVLLGYFDYQTPDGKVEDAAALIDQVPPEIRELNGRKIAVRGYMVPLEFDKGRVKTFLLTNNTLMCCYGVTPALNEFVHVTMEGDTTTRYLNNIPVTVYGTLQIGEEVRRGYVVSLYRLTAEKALGPADIARKSASKEPGK